MVKPKETNFKLLPEWAINQKDKSLIVSGGADARYEIVLENDNVSFFSKLKSDTYFTRNDLSEADNRVLEELITAEIVVPKLEKNKVLKVTVIGDSNVLNFTNDENLEIVKANQNFDIALIVRSNSTYAELLGETKYQSLTKPHLLIDIAYHHTLSVGPLVFPGETSCIACLQGRISTRWGDEKPPIITKMTKNYSGLVSELVKTELGRIIKDDTSLTNKTVSWNFQDRVVRSDQLLKVQICPICTKNRIDPNGTLALPWSKA